MSQSDFYHHAYLVFEEYVCNRGLKQTTIYRKWREVHRFFDYFRYDKDLRDITAQDIEKYFEHLKNESQYSGSSRAISKAAVADLYKALVRNELIIINPLEMTEIIIREQAGPRVILSEEEMKRLLESISPATGYGLRDRALFELMYVTGMRGGEILKLNVSDVDFSTSEVMISQGKGLKDRVVPLGKVAGRFLKRWIKKVRPAFLKQVSKDSGTVFLNSRNGERLSASMLRQLLKNYMKLAEIDKEGVTPHSLRHSCATHLLQHGADIRFVQELLGHSQLETTVGYTKEIISGLKKTHKRYHPRENELFVEEL